MDKPVRRPWRTLRRANEFGTFTRPVRRLRHRRIARELELVPGSIGLEASVPLAVAVGAEGTWAIAATLAWAQAGRASKAKPEPVHAPCRRELSLAGRREALRQMDEKRRARGRKWSQRYGGMEPKDVPFAESLFERTPPDDVCLSFEREVERRRAAQTGDIGRFAALDFVRRKPSYDLPKLLVGVAMRWGRVNIAAYVNDFVRALAVEMNFEVLLDGFDLGSSGAKRRPPERVTHHAPEWVGGHYAEQPPEHWQWFFEMWGGVVEDGWLISPDHPCPMDPPVSATA